MMKRLVSALAVTLTSAVAVEGPVPSSSTSSSEQASPIDRHELVTRHNIALDHMGGRLPVGNGEFCFGIDATGLQTFDGNTMAHWGWHSAPLPEGLQPSDIPATGNLGRGHIKDHMRGKKEQAPIFTWMRTNPHRLNLARLRFCHPDGTPVVGKEIAKISRLLDLWNGEQTSNFIVEGQPVRVVTCVHPELDEVAVRIESPLLESGKLAVSIDFPYGTSKGSDWKSPNAHKTTLQRPGASRAEFLRQVDSTSYGVNLAWTGSANLEQKEAHKFVLTPKADVLELACLFSPKPVSRELPSFAETRTASTAHWNKFWKSGGAIDLSASTDPRWKELERRIVLSQYEMAVQSAGSLPPAEVGLMDLDPWQGQFHMEMIWWHLAHYGLWNRLELSDKALSWYTRKLPLAQQLAKEFDYRGAKWGKMCGPEGRTATWAGSFVLHWQQPHPIFFAELEYRLRPTAATLEKWKQIVFETADYMADFPTLDPKTGFYSLTPVEPAAENGLTHDPAFESAYWRFGLKTAQVWRQRLGLTPDPRCAEVLAKLPPLPAWDGVYHFAPEWKDTYTKKNYSHPDPVGVFAFLPLSDAVDLPTARQTVLKVAETWRWDQTWGWDFPWMAMAAARVGEPQLAVDMLLKDTPRNGYAVNGINGGWYMPGNGGLLYAVAMMAAGWDGAPSRPAPGFPYNGQWKVKWEGLQKAP